MASMFITIISVLNICLAQGDSNSQAFRLIRFRKIPPQLLTVDLGLVAGTAPRPARERRVGASSNDLAAL
eukprot:7525312-Pyramimonas_sp.AAC.1